jgi:hypothetical protein
MRSAEHRTSSNLFDDLVAEASIASEPDEVALRLDPHFLQKRAPALTVALHAGQSCSILRLHCSQKVESVGFSLPQFAHRIEPPEKSD